MKHTKRILVAVSLGALFVAPLAAQKDQEELRREIEALKAGQDAIRSEIDLERRIDALQAGQAEIRKQLEEISKQLAARPAAAAPARPTGPSVAGMTIDLGNNVLKGNEDAKVTLVEFTDYQCPFCARYTQNTLPQIQKEYVDTGKIRYALLDLPLESIHKDAFTAAEATHCANDQGKYWEMHDLLFANQKKIEPINAHAETLGLDVAEFEQCMEAETYAKSVRNDMVQAQKVGASGTPSFVVARTDPNDPTKVTGVTFLRGAKAFNEFKAALDNALETSD